MRLKLRKKYSIIYADPPWEYSYVTRRGSAAKHYKTMSVEEICELPVSKLAADDSALFIWGTWPKIIETLKVIDAWGFRYYTCAFVWVKAKKKADKPTQGVFYPVTSIEGFTGMGRWTRSNTEFVLFGKRGQPKRVGFDVKQIVYAPVRRHSAKPPEVRDRILTLLGDLPRIELFAREATPGWDIWGNEVDSSVKLK